MKRLHFFFIMVVATKIVCAQSALCVHCNSKIFSSDNFCPSCGKDLNRVFQFDAKDIPLRSSGRATPLKMSLGGEIGFPWDDKCNVYGFDFAVFISKKHTMYGISVSGIMSKAKDSVGVTTAGFLTDIESCGGIMISGLGTRSKRMCGLSLATAANHAESLYGVQIGAFNFADKLRGVQIGLVNRAGQDACGLQIGVLNAIGAKGDLVSLPLVNMRF